MKALFAILLVTAQAAASYGGKPLGDVLRDLQRRGLNIIFSSELVKPEMTVVTEPKAATTRTILDEVLEPHGLAVRSGPRESLLVVRETRRPVVPDTRRPKAPVEAAVLPRAVPEPQAQYAPSLPTLLERAAEYVSGYEAQFSGLVAEEHYTQVVRFLARTMSRRVLRSDVLLIREEGTGWYGFRDVFEVDGGQVRDREDRLSRLFIKPVPGAVDRANAIMADSSRFNVGSLSRNINLPTMALTFLRQENLGRSQFTFGGSEVVTGQRTRIVEFVEILTPRMISTPDGAPARGRAWLDVASGRVVQTELTIDSVVSLSTVLVTYGPHASAPGVIVPIRMEEQYRVGPEEAITGVAVYSNFRVFTGRRRSGRSGRSGGRPHA